MEGKVGELAFAEGLVLLSSHRVSRMNPTFDNHIRSASDFEADGVGAIARLPFVGHAKVLAMRPNHSRINDYQWEVDLGKTTKIILLIELSDAILCLAQRPQTAIDCDMSVFGWFPFRGSWHNYWWCQGFLPPWLWLRIDTSRKYRSISSYSKLKRGILRTRPHLFLLARSVTMLDVLDFITDRGGDPQKVRESQRRRYADEGIVDEVIALYEDARASTERCSEATMISWPNA